MSVENSVQLTNSGCLSAMRQIAECPVCLQMPLGRVYICENSHPICDDCLPKVDKCPQGRCHYAKRRHGLRDRTMEKMIANLDCEVPCHWSNEGCTFKGNVKRAKRHKKQCCFRLMKCPDKDCTEALPILEFVNHMDLQHELKYGSRPDHDGTINEIWNLSWDSLDEEVSNYFGQNSYVYEHLDKSFIFKFRHSERKHLFYAWIHLIGSAKNAEEYEGYIDDCLDGLISE